MSANYSICSVEGCHSDSYRRGLCSGHYRRLLRTGSTDGMQKRAKRGEPLQFLESLIGTDESDCIIWPYGTSKTGYAQAHYMEKQTNAQRIMLLLISDLPFALAEAAHNCGISQCVNPNHLRWDTHVNNMADREQHGTVMRLFGERHGHSRLTNEQVIELRRLYATGEYSQRELSKMVGYSLSGVQQIISRTTWPHI